MGRQIHLVAPILGRLSLLPLPPGVLCQTRTDMYLRIIALSEEARFQQEYECRVTDEGIWQENASVFLKSKLIGEVLIRLQIFRIDLPFQSL
jgi:hypothetical protein